MTPEKREETARLAADLHDKKMRLRLIAERNIAGLSYKEAKQAVVDYELARAEVYEAEAKLAECSDKRPINVGNWSGQERLHLQLALDQVLRTIFNETSS